MQTEAVNAKQQESSETPAITFLISPDRKYGNKWLQTVLTYISCFAHSDPVHMIITQENGADISEAFEMINNILYEKNIPVQKIADITLTLAPVLSDKWKKILSFSNIYIPSRGRSETEQILQARKNKVEILLTTSPETFVKLKKKEDQDKITIINTDGSQSILNLENDTRADIDLEASLEFPQDIQIEMSSSCNARCVMCPITDNNRNSLIDYKLFASIIDQCSGRKELKRLWFQLYGESLLHPRITEAWEYARRNLPEAELGIFSNGSLMTGNMAEKALSFLDTLVFSVDGYTAEIYDSVRKGLDLEVVRENILRTIKLKEEMSVNTTICVNITVTKENMHEKEEFLTYWRNQGVHSNAYPEMNRREGRKSDFLRTPIPCFSPFYNMVVFSDGIVTPCCEDWKRKSPVGNANLQSIEEIWKSNFLKEFREKQISGSKLEIEACRFCDSNRWRLLKGFY